MFQALDGLVILIRFLTNPFWRKVTCCTQAVLVYVRSEQCPSPSMPPPPPAPPPPPPLVFAFTSSKQKRRSSKWSWGLGKKKKEVEAAPRERKNLNTLPVYQPGQFERRDASLRSKVSGMAQNTSSSRSSTPRPSPPLMASGSSTSLVTSASLERKIHDGVESILDGNVNTTERLAGLRGEMDKASVDF